MLRMAALTRSSASVVVCIFASICCVVANELARAATQAEWFGIEM